MKLKSNLSVLFCVILPAVLCAQGTMSWPMHFDTSNVLPHNETWHMEADEYGNVWVAPDYTEPEAPDGVYVFNGVFWSYLHPSNSELNNRWVLLIHSDVFGEVWLVTYGTVEYGLEIVKDGGWHYIDGYTIPWDFYMYAMASDSAAIWFAGDVGLLRFDRDTTWIKYDTSNSPLPNNPLDCMLVDRDGILWIGTRGRGLYRFDGQNWSNFNTTNSNIPGDYPSSIVQDCEGRIWIGFWYESNYHPVAQFDGVNTFIPYHASNFSCLSCFINFDAMALDADGHVYVAVNGTGVWRFDNNTWEQITPPPAVSLITAIRGCLVIDKENRIWLSLIYDGIWVSEPIPRATGVSDAAVESTSPYWYLGDDGMLWLHLGEELSGAGEVVVYDLLGRTMQTEKVQIVDGRTQLRLRQLPQGAYLVSVRTAGTMQTFKVPVLR